MKQLSARKLGEIGAAYQNKRRQRQPGGMSLAAKNQWLNHRRNSKHGVAWRKAVMALVMWRDGWQRMK